MSGEMPEVPLTEEEAVASATEVGIDAIRLIHRIEREMLSRAIQALVAATGKNALEVVTILSEGLDDGYAEAMKTAYAAAGIVTANEAGAPQLGDKKIATPKLILP